MEWEISSKDHLLRVTKYIEITTEEILNYALKIIREWKLEGDWCSIVRSMAKEYYPYYVYQSKIYMDGDGSWVLGNPGSGNMYLYVEILYGK